MYATTMYAEYISVIYKYGVLAKGKSMWKAQDEWRLVSCDDMLADDFNCAFYPITRVYLDMNMKNDQRSEIIEICKKEFPMLVLSETMKSIR